MVKYVQRSVRQPFFAGPYLQRGGGLFGTLGSLASRFLPFLNQGVKLVSSGLGNVMKNKYAKKVIKTGAKAALQGGKQLLEGENVKDVAKQTGLKVKKQTKRQLGKFLDKQIANIDAVPKKRKKKDIISTTNPLI